MTPGGVVATAPTPVDVDEIERALAALWRDAAPRAEPHGAPSAEPSNAPGAGPKNAASAETHGGPDGDLVTRACMSNLVIFCASPEEARSLPEEIGTIVERHPARVLLLVGDAAARGLEASVTAVCHLAGTGGERICSEHVTLEAARGAERSLPATVRALLIGDLPSALWWASPRPPHAEGPLFDELASLTDHVIWDSAASVDPAGGLEPIRRWAAAGGEGPPPSRILVSDLAWRRLKPWRWLIAQTLDPKREPGALESLEAVELEHGPGGVIEAWLLLGWLAARLGWSVRRAGAARGDELDLAFDTGAGSLAAHLRQISAGAAGLSRARLVWRGPAGAGHQEATFARAAPDRLEARLGSGAPRILAAPPVSRATLVARQLPKRFRDPVFRESLARARAMAEAPAR